MADKIYCDDLTFDIYELAKSGFTITHISKVLGISPITLRSWAKKKPLVKLALTKGKAFSKKRSEQGVSFRDHLYRRLPKNLQLVWKQITKLDRAVGGAVKIDCLLEREGKLARQHMFIYAYTTSNFSLTHALRKACISRSTLANWRKDPEFQRLIVEIDEYKKDFFEDHLVKLVAGGSESATIFANKTKNKERGYGDRSTVDINVSGTITHDHNIVSVAQLNLPLDVKKEILQSIRASRLPQTQPVELPAAKPVESITH